MRDGGRTMKIYLDVCCLNRPFDDQAQDRIRLESEAVLSILSRCQLGEWELVKSDALDLEMAKSPHSEKQEKVRALYSLGKRRLRITDQVKERALKWQAAGLKVFDSLHLALAEEYRQDVLLTTDDAFLATAVRVGADVVVANPVFWLMEVMRHDD